MEQPAPLAVSTPDLDSAKPVSGRASMGFGAGLHLYKQWTDGVARAMADYQTWTEQQGVTEGEQDLRVYELIQGLSTDKIVVALVGEFSRGKTELLNALFFSEFKQRLLPSTAGRTTMCPTELRYDANEPPCIKLLPIETRKTALSISEYRHTPVHWTTLHILKPNSVEEVREALHEVTRTKKVHPQEAKEFGLYHPDGNGTGPAPLTVDVPVWRHAIFNFPHPLLQQGLVILDTPGLNALGAEPELTLKTLPEAHGVLFLLAADVGVSRTDLDVWRNHLSGARGIGERGRVVVLNKIDILWDELQDEARIADSVAKQVRETARVLAIDERDIYPLSAQKALAGRIKADGPLLRRSGVFALEQRIAHDIIPAKYELIRTKVVNEISARVNDSRAVLRAQIATVDKQLAELKQLSGRNADTIAQMVAKVQAEKQQYDRELQGFELTRTTLTTQAKTLLQPLSLASIDALIDEARTQMHDSWTTHGLRAGMAVFFAGANARMTDVERHAAIIQREVQALYQQLRTQYGFARLTAPAIPLTPYLQEFKRLARDAEAFRTSPVTAMTEQHFIIRKFFVTLAARARFLFQESNKGAKAWFQALMTPAFTHLRDHRAHIEAQLAALRKIHKNANVLGEQIAALESTRSDLGKQAAMLEDVLARIECRAL